MRGKLDVEVLLQIVLVLVIIWLALAIVDQALGLVGSIFGLIPFSSLVGVAIVVLIALWWLDYL